MFVQQSNSGGLAWYRTREITVKLTTGETLTGSPVEVTTIGSMLGAPPEKRCFTITASCSLFQIACEGKIAEVVFDGVRYRVFAHFVVPPHVRLHCEPIGTVPVMADNTSVHEQIMTALRAAPDGLTARQIGETLECSRSSLFSALNALVRSNRATKDGALYRALEQISGR